MGNPMGEEAPGLEAGRAIAAAISATLERNHGHAVLSLVRSDLSQRSEAIRRIVETAAHVLGVDRVGLWFFDADRTSIVVEDLYLPGEDRHESGARLTAGEYPSYFAALAESRVVAADDAGRDPRTLEFSDSYLDPLEVRSMLDVPVRSEGVVIGVLCHECVGTTREWTVEDREFAASLADLVGTVVETSRRRRTEAELRELAASLERRVAERTTDLEASNRALVGAVHDLEAFCYSVSHDLRGPLRVINGFASLLESSGLAAADPEACESVSRIRDNTNRMSQLLDGLLAFFRLGQRPIDAQRVDMDSLLRETLDALGVDPGTARLRAEPLLPAHGDPALIADVLANLLSNAFKFTSRQPAPLVEVACEAGDGEVIYHVRDNGVGFHVEHAARLFEPFQRFHSAEGYEGTGVGLAIVRRIVERHGGRVWANAVAAKGATFSFALPRCEAGPDEGSRRRVAQPEAGAAADSVSAVGPPPGVNSHGMRLIP
ncbi:MAG: ATP-binding protein [Candidatus Binatia bacterium]